MSCGTQATDCQTNNACTLQGVGVTLMNRVVDNDLDLTEQYKTNSISYEVIDDITGVIVEVGAVPISSITILQSPPEWGTTDDIGYNWRWLAPGSCFPGGDQFYHVYVSFVPASGGIYKLYWRVWSQAAGSG